jgi:hypothetical protein
LKFWKDNQADAGFDLPEAEVARLFSESRWAGHPWPLERRLRAFLTDPNGPISAVWEDEAAFGEVRRLAATPPGAAAAPTS